MRSLLVTYSKLHNRTITHRMLYAFFLLASSHPTTTLFPYTTLFRSRLKSEEYQTRSWRGRPVRCAKRSRGVACSLATGSLDRKSTRLNSSHSQISYAVFCLKKKKDYATTTINYKGNYTKTPANLLIM